MPLYSTTGMVYTKGISPSLVFFSDGCGEIEFSMPIHRWEMMGNPRTLNFSIEVPGSTDRSSLKG